MHHLALAFDAVILGIVVAVSLAHAAEPVLPSPLFGTWSTEDGHGVIAIEQCGDALCGRIVGIDRAPGGPIPNDVHGVSQCGLAIITKERPAGNGSWLGEITNPRTGTTYRAKLWLDDIGNLRVRGFLGLPLLGQTLTWHHFTGHLTAACELM
jgi:uncharacterized protein (DUF2147 family)